MSDIISCKLTDFDTSEKYILKMTTKSIDPTSEEVKEYLETLDKIASNIKGNFVIVVDTRNMAWISGKARIEIGKGNKRLEEKYKDRYKRNFTVVPNAIVKLMLKTVNVVAKPIIKQEVYAKYDNAIAEARKVVSNW